MSLVNRLRKIKNNLFYASAFPNDIDAFKSELDLLNITSMNLIMRSIASFKIKYKYSDIKGYIKVIKKIFYGVGFLVYQPYIFLQKKPRTESHVKVAYYKISDNEGIVPDEIVKMNMICVKMGSGLYLDNTARRILKESKRLSKMNLAFLFEVIFSLANYSYINEKYSPDIIVTAYESSPIASILTQYCREKNILHYNIMHGDKFFSHVNTLGEFDLIYVWDEFYKSLFRELKYNCKQYKIYNPWYSIPNLIPTFKHDFTFYLNREGDDALKKCVQVAKAIRKKGYTILLRPHPSQMKEIKDGAIIPDEMLEDTREVSIYQSLSNTSGAISLYSTVLFQASLCGKEIIIDDVTNKKAFDQLRSVKYIMMNKPHKRLSIIIGELN